MTTPKAGPVPRASPGLAVSSRSWPLPPRSSRHGYASASLAAIAARVGVTKTLLHQYFGAKQDLFLACLTPVGDQLLDSMRAAMAEGDATAARMPLLVLRAIFTALDGRREGWFVLYDASLPADSEPARSAARYRTAIDQLAATGTADLLRATGSPTRSMRTRSNTPGGAWSAPWSAGGSTIRTNPRTPWRTAAPASSPPPAEPSTEAPSWRAATVCRVDRDDPL